MKIIIIGAVAAGTSAAAKARRNNEEAEIVLYEKDTYISYSGCGMPYYLGRQVQRLEELVPRDPAFFKSKYNVDVRIGHEVLRVEPAEKRITVKKLETGEIFEDHYDTLILATGARSVAPPLPGLDHPHVFMLRNINDMNRIDAFIRRNEPKQAVIIGTGFIGLEVCENFTALGMKVTLIEKLPQVTPGLDADMAALVEAHLVAKGVEVRTNSGVTSIEADRVVLSVGATASAGSSVAPGSASKVGTTDTADSSDTAGTVIPADIVIVATGVRPEVGLAKEAGVHLGATGAIAVDERMRTNIPDVYACGDCIEHFHLVTGAPVYRPLGSTANKTGRIAGDCATGGTLEFRGVLGTGIFLVYDKTVAQTGLSERDAKAAGYEVAVCHNIKPDRPEYMGGREMTIKAVADKRTGRLLGVQIVGEGGVDKRIDVFVTAITFGAKAEDLFHLDLAYAPPFSTTKDPVHYTGMILDNAIAKGRPLMTAEELEALMASGEAYTLIDARAEKQFDAGHIPSARSIPQEKLRAAAERLDPEVTAITYCNKGVTGNAAQNILLGKGFRKVFNVSGGNRMFSSKGKD